MYTQQQLMWLNYAQRSNPAMVPQLMAQFRAANQPTFDASAGDAEAATAANRYRAETVNPQLGSVAVADGPNPSSFAAARQADLIAAGNRTAGEVSEMAKNGAYDRALKLYQIQLQQANSEDNSGYGGGFGGGRGQQQDTGGSDIGGRIAGGVMELGKRYLDAKRQGTFNPQQTGKMVGNGLKDLIAAPFQFGSGILRSIQN